MHTLFGRQVYTSPQGPRLPQGRCILYLSPGGMPIIHSRDNNFVFCSRSVCRCVCVCVYTCIQECIPRNLQPTYGGYNTHLARAQGRCAVYPPGEMCIISTPEEACITPGYIFLYVVTVVSTGVYIYIYIYIYI